MTMPRHNEGEFLIDAHGGIHRFPRQPGIYLIEHEPTGETYVGATCRTIRQRDEQQIKPTRASSRLLLAAITLLLCGTAARADSLPTAASLLMQQQIVQDEADYAMGVDGDRKAACRLWRKSFQLGGDAYAAFPSERTGTAQILPAVALKEHCLDIYPDFGGYPLPRR